MAPKSRTASLNIVIAGDNRGAKKAIAGTEKDMKGLGASAKSLAVGLGSAYAVTKVVQWGKASADAYRTVGGEVIKLQRYTGLAAEDASGLRLAAAMSGLDIAKLSTSLGQLNKRIESGSVDDLGFQFRDARDEILPMDQILGQIMDRFAEMPNGPEKTALAMQLFGRAGADLIPLLSRGSAALEEFKQQAEDLGLSFDEQGLADVKEATKNQRELNQALLGMKVAVGAELTPLINDVTTLGKEALPPLIAGLRTSIGLFTALPPGIQATVVGLGTASVVIPKVAGAVNMLAASNIGLTSSYYAVRSALTNNVSNLKASTVGFAAAGAAVASYALTTAALNKASDMRQINIDVGHLTTSLETLGRTREFAGVLSEYGEGLDLLAEKFRQSDYTGGEAARGIISSVLFGRGDLGIEADAAQKDIDDLDKALAALAERDPELADQAFGQIAKALHDQGISMEDVGAAFDDYYAAADNAALAQENATAATEENTEANDRNAASQVRLTSAVERANQAIERRQQRANAIISATDGVRDAERAAADAAEELAEAQKEAGPNSEAIAAAREGEADALQGLADAQDQVRDAEEALADAGKTVLERRQDLNEAIAEAREEYEDLQLAARAAGDAEAQAALDVRAAQEELNRILADAGSSQLERDQAAQDLREALTAQAQAAEEAADAQREAAQDPNQSEGVISAREALADAYMAERDAAVRVIDAQAGVVDADKRVQEARRNTAAVTEETRKRVQEAERASQDATRGLVEAQATLAGAVGTTRDQVSTLRDGLRALAEDYAPGSPYRLYLEGLIDLLGGVLEAGNIPQDESRDPVGNGFRRPGATGSSTQDESRDPIRPRSRGVTYAPTVNVYGSDIEVQRRMRQEQDRHADRLAQAVTGG